MKNSLFTRISAGVLAFAALVAFAMPLPSLAQTVPEQTHGVVAKKKKKPASSARAMTSTPSEASKTSDAQQAQNPLSPIYSIPNQNNTNGSVVPFTVRKTSFSSSRSFRLSSRRNGIW